MLTFKQYYNESNKALSITLGALMTLAPNIKGQNQSTPIAIQTTARGITNNNPGNIRIGQNWNGQIGSDGQFVIFKSPEYGIRALGKIIKTYQIKYHLYTISQMISKWSPPNENNTQKYINFVAKKLNVSAIEPLHLFDSNGRHLNEKLLIEFINAIIQSENSSNPYSQQTIQTAVSMID